MPPDSITNSTTLTSSAGAGATTISVATPNAVNIDAGGNVDFVTIALSDGTTFTTRGISPFGTSNPVSIELPLPAAANNGATVNRVDKKLDLVLYIETGGERLELGLITEWAGDYLLNGTSSSLNALRQHAEIASSEWPFYLTDAATGTFLNFKSDNTHYKVIIGPNDYGGYYRAAFTNLTNGWDFHENDSHFQMHPYIAYALTEDPYFLEGTQALVNYGSGCTGTMLGREGNLTASHGQIGWGDLLGTPNGTGGVNGSFTMCSYYGEIRTVGNGCRNLAMAWKCAQTSPPSWMLPRSYYDALSGDYLKVIDSMFTNSGHNLNTVFFQLSIDPFYQAFEQSYGLMGMAIADMFGLPANGLITWFSTLTFYFGMIDAITNGTSGWNNQCPQPHDLDNTSGGFNFNAKANFTALWSAVQSFVQTGATFPSAAQPGNQQGGSMGNCNMILAAAACAKSRSVTAASAAFTRMNTFIDYNYPNNADASMGIAFEMKCGFDGT